MKMLVLITMMVTILLADVALAGALDVDIDYDCVVVDGVDDVDDIGISYDLTRRCCFGKSTPSPCTSPLQRTQMTAKFNSI